MSFEPFNWNCPYCNQQQTVTESRYSRDEEPVRNSSSVFGPVRVRAKSIVCANGDCGQLWLRLALHGRTQDGYGNVVSGEEIKSWQVLPESSAKPQPDYIPEAIRADYVEACRILHLSPKASATLARRCLQGMIRDFAGIAEKTLFREIKKLREALDKGEAPKGVTSESVEAIDHVRQVGNIGAHMEDDVNLIVEIDPEEADKLIGLIEMLFKEWYVARHERERRLEALKALAQDKKVAKKPNDKGPSVETEAVVGADEGESPSNA